MFRFKPNIQWPGRNVRPGLYDDAAADDTPTGGAGEERETLALIPKEAAPRVRGELDETRRALAQLRRRADEELRIHLHISAANRPVVQNAVDFISGHHRSFGSGRPAVPPEHRISTSDGSAPREIDSRIYRRALDIIDHADRIFYGFDMRELGEIGFDGEVTVFEPPASPAEAAGDVDAPRRPEKMEIEAAIDESLFMTKREIFRYLFWSVMQFILTWFADLFDNLARRIERLLRIKVLGVTVNIGKPIAWPFRQLASLLRQGAAYFQDLIDGLTHTRQAPEAPRADLDERGGEGGAESAHDEDVLLDGLPFGSEEAAAAERQFRDELAARSHERSSWEIDPGSRSGSGIAFLMAARKVTETTHAAIEEPGRADLLRALRTYHQSRRSDELYAVYHDMGEQMGVRARDLQLTSDTEDLTAAGDQTERSSPAQETSYGRERTSGFDCD